MSSHAFSGWMLAAALATAPAWAQEPADLPTDSAQRGVATVADEPEVEAAPEAEAPAREFDRTPVLPGIAEGTGDALSAQARVFVNRVEVEGLTLLTPETVAQAAAPYTGREVTAEELGALQNRLSLAYFDAGYVNSGVVLPDQDVRDGVIVFREITGRITQINLEGNRALNDHWWLNRIGRGADGTLQINALQDTLQVLEQQPLVQRIEARLVPGVTAGEATLEMRVVETRPWRLELGIDNHRSPSLGGEQLTVRFQHLSLTGHGDRLEAYANLADGLGDGGLAYTLPLGSTGAALRAYASGGNADIVEAPFDIVNIQSKTQTAGIELAVPFWQRPNGGLSAVLGLEARHSESTLLDRPFSFSLGEIDGESDTTAVRAGLVWTHRDDRQVIAAQLFGRFGNDWGKAATNPIVPDGLNGPKTEFSVLQGQAQYIRRLGWRDSELHLRGAFQLASDPLLPVEKMPVGGAWSVRGYRENLLVRDNGLTATAEWRLPLFRDREPTSGFDACAITAVAFADFGQSWDQDTGLPSDRKTRLYSVGLGVVWSPLPRWTVQLFRGEALNDVGSTGDDLQDNGWHFRLAFQAL